MKSILQDWVTDLGLRHQGVLLTIVRGFDGWSKHAPQKPLIREMRGLILNPYDPRELQHAGGFMVAYPHEPAAVAFQKFLDNIDGLPVHYVMHIAHACEIIGYCHPDIELSHIYHLRYLDLCNKFHLRHETADLMHRRLTSDRIKEGTVET